MKKHFLAAIVIAFLAAGSAHAQTFSAPINKRERVQRRTPEMYQRPAVGAFPRAARGGNPLHLLNPRAPRQYFGTPDETVTYDQNNPSRITGLILFGLRW